MKNVTNISRITLRLGVNFVLVVVTLASLAFVLPSLFGYQRYEITGGSMSGTFEKGSLAFEKVVPVSEVKVGDVITYQPPASTGLNGLVTHRVVAMNTSSTGTWFHTKGDANPAADPWKFQLTGDTQPRVSFTVPYAGYAFLALADRETRMVVIGIPAGIIAILCLLEVGGAFRSPAKKRVIAPTHLATS